MIHKYSVPPLFCGVKHVKSYFLMPEPSGVSPIKSLVSPIFALSILHFPHSLSLSRQAWTSCLPLLVHLANYPSILKCPQQDARHRGAYQKKQWQPKMLPRRRRKKAPKMRQLHHRHAHIPSLRPRYPRASNERGLILHPPPPIRPRRPSCPAHTKPETFCRPFIPTPERCPTTFAQTSSNTSITLAHPLSA
jgi:hypothetical protein